MVSAEARGGLAAEALVIDLRAADLADAVGALIEAAQSGLDIVELALDVIEEGQVGRALDVGRGRGVLRVHSTRLGERRNPASRGRRTTAEP